MRAVFHGAIRKNGKFAAFPAMESTKNVLQSKPCFSESKGGMRLLNTACRFVNQGLDLRTKGPLKVKDFFQNFHALIGQQALGLYKKA